MNDIDRLESEVEELKGEVVDLRDVVRALFERTPFICPISHEPHWRDTRTCWLCEAEIPSEQEALIAGKPEVNCVRCDKQLAAGPPRVCADCKQTEQILKRTK